MSIPRLRGADICRVASAVLFCTALLLPCCEVHARGNGSLATVANTGPLAGASKFPKAFAGYQCVGLAAFAALFVTQSIVLNSWATGSFSAGIKSVPLSLVACAVSLVALPAFGVYLPLAFTPYFPRVRRALATLTVICFSASVLFFVESDFRPAIGWYLWMLSILLSIAPEVLLWTRSSADDGSID